MELAPRTVQKHAGLFAAGTDDRFATGFDDAGADEQVLRSHDTRGQPASTVDLSHDCQADP